MPSFLSIQGQHVPFCPTPKTFEGQHENSELGARRDFHRTWGPLQTPHSLAAPRTLNTSWRTEHTVKHGQSPGWLPSRGHFSLQLRKTLLLSWRWEKTTAPDIITLPARDVCRTGQETYPGPPGYGWGSTELRLHFRASPSPSRGPASQV